MTNQLSNDCQSMNHYVTCPACKYPKALAMLMLSGAFCVACDECGYGHSEQKFLESQQQSTVTVPAVSTAAEILSSGIPFSDEVDFNNLMGLFKILGALADRSPDWQKTFVVILSKYMAPDKNVFKAPLYVVLHALTDTQDYFAALTSSDLNNQ